MFNNSCSSFQCLLAIYDLRVNVYSCSVLQSDSYYFKVICLAADAALEVRLREGTDYFQHHHSD
jgi:hypothetical protein